MLFFSRLYILTQTAISTWSSNFSIMAVNVYHCLCTQISVATATPLKELPKRQSDGSAIAEVGDFGSSAKATMQLQNTKAESQPVVLKLDDGFEKRYSVNCTRCGLMTGYHLDKSQYENTTNESGPNTDVLYLLPGGLITTEEMQSGKDMEKEIGLIATG